MLLKFAIAALGMGVAGAAGQNAPSTPAGGNEPATFRTNVQTVTIPVVVRDRQGHAVGALEKEDFQLFDNGKPREIELFSVEKSGDAGEETHSPADPNPEAQRAPARLAPDILPARFVGYLFDDIHMKAGDLMQVRKAAAAHFSSALGPRDRGAVFTTSGVITVDFTSDRDALQKALLRLAPHPLVDQNTFACPQIGYYQADLIANKKEPMAIRTALGELLACEPSIPVEEGLNRVDFDARAVLIQGEREGQTALASVLDVIRHMEVLAGQRTLILISPGFLTPDLRREVSEIIHTGIKARVTVSSLDARGLWTDPSFDLSTGHNGGGAAPARRMPGSSAGSGLPSGAEIARMKSSFLSTAAFVAADSIAEISAGTGGRLFHDSNDLKGGLEQIASAPEYVYMLAFSPGDLKNDGKYHNIKVTIRNPNGLTVDARKGYFAPIQFGNPVEQAKDNVREAVFSREELKDFPVDVIAQLVKQDENTGRIVVQTRFYPQSLKLRKADGRNYGQVRMVCSVFDANGQYIKAVEKVMDLQIRDEVFEQQSKQGVVSRTDIEVKPGRYLVRVVIRDVEGQQTAARNVAVGEERDK